MTSAESHAAHPWPPGAWRLDADRTRVQIQAKNFIFKTVGLNLKLESGTVTIDKDGAVSAVEAKVDAASVDSGNLKRDDHLRSGDFLDIDTYPNIGFSSRTVRPSPTGYEIDGELTVKAKGVSTTLAVDSVEVDRDHASFIATGTVNRHALRLTRMPSFMIGNDLMLIIVVHATQS